MDRLLLHTHHDSLIHLITNELSANWTPFSNQTTLLETPKKIHKSQISQIKKRYQVDINRPTPHGYPIKLALFDMDQTLIPIETLDCLAKEIKLPKTVLDYFCRLTEQAMSGKLSFEESFKKRIQCLKNVSRKTISLVYDKYITLSPGGEQLITYLQTNHIYCAVVSGGLIDFVEPLAKKLGMHHWLANTVIYEDNKLTGEIQGELVDKQAKANFLLKLCELYQLHIGETIVIGDGDNDIEMMKLSGMSVAYHGKPSVCQQADYVIEYSSLAHIIDLIKLIDNN